MTQSVFCRSSAFRGNLKPERQQVSPKLLCVITILHVLINLKGATSNLTTFLSCRCDQFLPGLHFSSCLRITHCTQVCALLQHVFYNLTFICPCITNIFPCYNEQDATFLDLFISTDAVHVSGGSSAHHQEHKAVQYSFQVLSTNTAASCWRG